METVKTSVGMYLLSENHFKELSDELKEIKQTIKRQSEKDLTMSYIDSKSVPKLLNISTKTWQTYRDKGIIPFIQVGSKIWVKRTDIDNFMSAHYIKKSF